jgi:hypothetical protein
MGTPERKVLRVADFPEHGVDFGHTGAHKLGPQPDLPTLPNDNGNGTPLSLLPLFEERDVSLWDYVFTQFCEHVEGLWATKFSWLVQNYSQGIVSALRIMATGSSEVSCG